MADATDADTLAAAAYRAVQAGDWPLAVAQADSALALLTERPALAARLHAWAAQAHIGRQDFKAARRRLSAALRAARQTGRADEVSALQPLQQQIMAAMTARARGAETPTTPAAAAVAAYDAGDLEAGERLALQARALAERSGDDKEAVVSLLALARTPARRAEAIREAADVADRSGDRNLVTAVAHAARAAQVVLPPKVF
jgi:hypothetical protein